MTDKSKPNPNRDHQAHIDHNHNHGFEHGHKHGHEHHHHHIHGVGDLSKASLGRIRLAFLLNFAFAIVELVGGLWVNSLAIMSSALHDLGDSVALALAYFLESASHKRSDHKYSYGYRRYSTLAALLTGVILVIGSAWILVESLPRIWSPESSPKAEGMIALAVLGLTVNGVAAARLSRGHSLNEKMLLWHLLEDVMSWALVLIGGLILMIWPWNWLDPLLAVLLSLWVIRNVYRNLRQALQVFLQAVPASINMEKVKLKILQVKFVRDVHHMHVWTLDGMTHILTAHIALEEGLTLAQWDQAKGQVKQLLYAQGLAESTLEFEDGSQTCLEPQHEPLLGKNHG